jgi:hypothetical protein
MGRECEESRGENVRKAGERIILPSSESKDAEF